MQLKVLGLTLLTVLLLSACASSPKHAYALETEKYGQCHAFKKGEGIRYQKRLVDYICEEGYLLYGEPYESGGEWFYPALKPEKNRLKPTASTRVSKRLHNICQVRGKYGVGKESHTRFYFDQNRKVCTPFTWSGEGGLAPFTSRDECEVNCHY